MLGSQRLKVDHQPWHVLRAKKEQYLPILVLVLSVCILILKLGALTPFLPCPHLQKEIFVIATSDLPEVKGERKRQTDRCA